MRRRCTCGCEDFYAVIVREEFLDGLVCFSDPAKTRIAERDLTGKSEKFEHAIGPYVCVDCDNVYSTVDDIPLADPSPVEQNG